MKMWKYMSSKERMESKLTGKRSVHEALKDIIETVFLVDITMDQIETCWKMKNDWQKWVIVDNPVSEEVMGLYEDAIEYMDENYYALYKYVCGTEPYLTPQGEMDIEDVWTTVVDKYGIATEDSTSQIIEFSMDKDRLERRLEDEFCYEEEGWY